MSDIAAAILCVGLCAVEVYRAQVKIKKDDGDLIGIIALIAALKVIF